MSLDENLYALFAAQARATPEAVAVIESPTATTTYRALALRAAQVSDYLKSRNLAPEQPVGVLMKRSADLVAVLLGILKSGGAYVPIDPDDPPQRQQRILDRSGCQLVLAHRACLNALGAKPTGHGFELVAVEDLHEASPDPFSSGAPGGARLAYILFTSGSTGEPKGVEIEHRSVVNVLTASRQLLGITADDCFLAAATIGFDISVIEIFLPLITGGRLLLRDRTCWLNPAGLAEEIRRYGVTVVQTGPSTWAVLLAEAPDFPRVRVVISTAEPIRVDTARQLLPHGEQAWNLYGPTETTVWSTAFRMTRETLEQRSHTALSVSIGHPLANTSLILIDEEGQPVAPGQRGELCIGGLGLARGYRGDAGLTGQKFIQLGTPGERYYRTGDVAAWSPEGDLHYFGRNDDQMKIRGVRIDPGEVEAAILSHPLIRRAAATWYATPSGARSIIAAVVPQPGAAPTTHQLHDWLAERVPGPMIPSQFVFAEDLPRSPSGKIDRVAIRNLAGREPAQPPASATTALSPTEEKLRAIWQRLLGRTAIAADDHFFTIGGDSLAAVRVLTQVEETFGLSLSVQTIFEAPTLRQLAAQLDRATQPSRWRRWMNGLHAGWLNRPSHGRGAEAPPGDLIARQRVYVLPWKGKRVRPDALVVTLNARGSRPGLFWCLQGYRELTQLAGQLGPDQPMHGLRSGYLIVDYDNPKDIDLLATRYAAEIQDVQPTGALVLGGNCQGGIIMRAVADKLLADGRSIALLILMEQRYVAPYPGRVALIFGRESHLNPYPMPAADPEPTFRAAFPAGYQVEFVEGAHGEFFESPNVESLAAILTKLLTSAEGCSG